MKTSNILLTATLLAVTIALGYYAHKEYNGTLGALCALSSLLFICAFNLLLEDLNVAVKRRKRRAMALRMTGWQELRGGAWLKIENEIV